MSVGPIPVTVFTGFLGAGKTTIILSLLTKLPKSLKVVLLKNEFGDVKVDSELAQESNVQVAEMINGCLCCVLVGQMKNALLEIKGKLHPIATCSSRVLADHLVDPADLPISVSLIAEKQQPDRIIIETSGSAFPAPIAWQIREIASQGFELDAIVTVIDCANFRGYEDTSYTARMQAQYTDMILLNKHDQVSERELDLVIDRIDELNTDTPKVRVPADGISPSLIFGLSTSLFLESGGMDALERDVDHHANEVDLIHIQQDLPVVTTERTTQTVSQANALPQSPYSRAAFEATLARLSKDDVYRVKGFVRFADSLPDSVWIVNWAFGRLSLTPSTRLARADSQNGTASPASSKAVLLTVMGHGLATVRHIFEQGFPSAQITLTAAHRH
eukprot:jgi/Hompol1/2616/HPOL_006094-RA